MKRIIREIILEAVLVLLCIYLAFNARGFTGSRNFFNIISNVSIPGIIAFGMTMVIIAGEIDLSVGSAAAFSGCLLAVLTNRFAAHMPLGLAILLGACFAILCGIIIGTSSGLLRVRFGVPTFISTLAWYLILRGIAGQITGGMSVGGFPGWFTYIGQGRIGNTVPITAIIFLAVFIIIQFVMNYTTFGRAIYAVGGNAEAARLSGINVLGIKIGVMAIVACLAMIAGMLQASQVEAGIPTIAVGWELDVIAAVIVGGTSLQGGAGRIWGTFIGMIFLGVLINGMTLLNYLEYPQMMVRGGIILIAVLLNTTLSNRK